MRHFLFEEREYRIRPGFRRARKDGPDSALALARLLRVSSRKAGGHGGGPAPIPRKPDTRQRCVAKMNYSTSLDAHRVQLERYLVREGSGRDGERAELYGTDPAEYRKNMVGKNFRIFLSPQSDKMDLKLLAEKFVRRLELQTGYRLHWQGANHHNTAHPHVHLLINGKDKNGREVDFPRDVVRTFMRENARDILTASLGARTERDLEAEREGMVRALRFTRLDETIKELCAETSGLILPRAAYRDRERVRARLEALRGLGLCAYRDGAYRLSPRWEETLRANGRYNVFLKAREGLRYTPPAGLAVFGGRGEITGKVTRIYRTDDDASDSHAVVLEALDGKAWFVPLFRKPETAGGKGGRRGLEENALVTVRGVHNQKGRLTPVFLPRDERELRREIRKHSLSGRLAEEIAGGGKRAGRGGQ